MPRGEIPFDLAGDPLISATAERGHAEQQQVPRALREHGLRRYRRALDLGAMHPAVASAPFDLDGAAFGSVHPAGHGGGGASPGRLAIDRKDAIANPQPGLGAGAIGNRPDDNDGAAPAGQAHSGSGLAATVLAVLLRVR